MRQGASIPRLNDSKKAREAIRSLKPFLGGIIPDVEWVFQGNGQDST